MTGVLICVAMWLVVAMLFAAVLGRVTKRADEEELGSTLDWDTTDIGEAVQHDH